MPDQYDASAGARILICEDELLVAKDVALTLRDLGYETAGMVATGEEAIRKAEEVRPDLILMDINLAGEIDGIEAVQQIRAQFDIPVVYLTAYAEKDVFERAQQTEPDGYMGKPVRLLELRCTVETVLHKHQAYRRVRESEERFRKVFEQGPIGMGLVGTDGRFFVVNSQLCQMLGYTEDELTRLTFVDITHPDHVTQDLEAVRRLYAGEIPYYKAEKRYIKKDGDILWGNLTAAVIRDAEGKSLYTLPMIEDITERKKAQEELAKAEELQRTILSTSPVGIGLSVDRKMVWVNDAWKEMFGLGLNDADGLTLNARALYPTQEEFERVGKVLYEGLEAGQANETDARMIRKDGTIFDVHIAMKAVEPSDPSRGTIAAITDITDRKKAAEALRKSEAKYRFLTEHASDLIWTLDLNLRTTFVTPSVEKVLGFTPEERMLQDVEDQLTPESLEFVQQRLLEELRIERELGIQEGKSVLIDLDYWHKKGSIVCLQTAVAFIRDEKGTPVGLHGISRDITELKRTQEALRESEERYRQITENSLTGIYVYQDGRSAYANRRLAEMLGHNPEEILGIPFLDAIHPDDRNMVKEMAQARLAGQPAPNHYELRLLHKDGHTVWSEVLSHRIDYQGRPGILGNIADVTESRILRQQLIQAQKMEAIGTMTGGIAHDFNNLLTIINGYTELILSEKTEDDPIYADLKKILETGRKGAEMVQRLLAFSKKAEISRQPLDLNGDCRKRNQSDGKNLSQDDRDRDDPCEGSGYGQCRCRTGRAGSHEPVHQCQGSHAGRWSAQD